MTKQLFLLGLLAVGGVRRHRMADFDIAFRRMMEWEGGYSCDERDSGGETFRGISRANFPEWRGWALIDALPNGADPCQNVELEVAAEEFYEEAFWRKIRGGEIKDQSLADAMLDAAVNMGIHHSVVFAQTSVNVLRERGKLAGDPLLEVDGGMGPATLEALNKASERAGEELLKMYGAHRMARYSDVVIQHPKNTIFLKGWQRRALAFLDQSKERKGG